LQKKQTFFPRIAFHPLFIRVLSNFTAAPTFQIFGYDLLTLQLKSVQNLIKTRPINDKMIWLGKMMVAR
jgi:hypothetical protein